MTTKRSIVLIAGAAAMGLSAATAYAVLVTNTGGSLTRRDIRTETAASSYSGVYAPLPGAAVPVTVPSGQSRLFTASFFAESGCTGPGGTSCTLRILAKESVSGTITGLNPTSGVDFAFDSAAGDSLESHAMARTVRLGGGSYTIYVERATTSPGTTFLLDDWTFMVDTNT
jgi:hypothetical protein